MRWAVPAADRRRDSPGTLPAAGQPLTRWCGSSRLPAHTDHPVRPGADGVPGNRVWRA